MRHFIIVKFNNLVNAEDLIEPIKVLFEQALEINGIDKVKLYKSNINLPNRYDLMIEMELTRSGLTAFDNSKIHSKWKEEYGKYIDNKTIFDCD